jgi:hypothetical protein
MKQVTILEFFLYVRKLVDERSQEQRDYRKQFADKKMNTYQSERWPVYVCDQLIHAKFAMRKLGIFTDSQDSEAISIWYSVKPRKIRKASTGLGWWSQTERGNKARGAALDRIIQGLEDDELLAALGES